MPSVMTLEELSDCIDFSYHMVRDKFDGRNGYTIWSCTIACNGKSYTAEYTKGCGHRVYTKSSPSGMLKRKATNKRVVIPYGSMPIHEAEELKASVPVPPNVEDFMYSLMMDAQAADCNDFEDFCGEFGYSDDSISAKKTYDACCETYMALSHMDFDLSELSELFKDY